MKTTGELIRLLSDLTQDDIHNLCKLRLLHPERQRNGKNYLFPEKDFLLLKSAFPEWKRGMKPKVAFKNAEVEYEKNTNEILDGIYEYCDSRYGHAPTLNHVLQFTSQSISELSHYIAALVEGNRLNQDQYGRLTPLSVFSPVDLPASTKLPKYAYMLLDEKKKMALRNVALELFLSETKALPDDQKVPVPITILEKERFYIEHRNLGRGCFAYVDPSEKKIFLSPALKKNVVKKRLVLMHEYFHVFLSHGKRTCAWTDNCSDEAEATYAAIYYLVPLHTFDLVMREVINNGNGGKGFSYDRATLEDPLFIEKMANKYQISPEVIFHYICEHIQSLST